MDISAGTIVVGVDGSVASLRALGWAAQQAVVEHRPVTLVNAAGSTPSSWADAAIADPDVAREMLEGEGREILTEARAHAERRAPGADVREVFRNADPRELLLDLSRNAHMLVIGSRGLGRLRSLLLGSVGIAAIRHSACPVVVHRPGNAGAVRHGIVVGADAGEDSRAVLEFAYRQASLRRLPLTVLHCTRDAQAIVTGPHLLPTKAVDVERERLALAESMAGLGEKYPDVVAHTEVTRGPPQEGLVRMGARMDLVVVGSHEPSRTERILFGSVSTSVVEHATCPVAVVPLGSA